MDSVSLPKVPLNGFPGAFAGVLRHCVVGGQRRPWDRSPQGLSNTTKVVKPMEWTPPPDGIAMCQDGTERFIRTI